MSAIKRTSEVLDDYDTAQSELIIQKSFRKKLDLNSMPIHTFDRITPATKYNEFEPIFDKLAEEIINQYEYIVCGRSLRIREIEFYVNHPNHSDLYAHKSLDLRKMGGWYFHKIGSAFQSGTRKGHDITFGTKNHVGGILIRSLEDHGKIIDGCSLCVDHILKICHEKYKEITDVPSLFGHKLFSNNIFDENAPIFIRKMTGEVTKFKYYKCPRVGLGDKYPEYRDKLYRYLVLPAKVKKGRDGVIKSLLDLKFSPQKISELTGCLLNTIAKFVKK